MNHAGKHKIFNDRQVEQFAKINKDVQTVQEKIASGQNILKAGCNRAIIRRQRTAKPACSL